MGEDALWQGTLSCSMVMDKSLQCWIIRVGEKEDENSGERPSVGKIMAYFVLVG